MIGIIGAMDEEVISVKRRMHVTEQREIAGKEFFIGTIDEKEVVVVQSGTGKVNAAICTQILIDVFNVTHMVSTGVASALYPELNIGDIILASDLGDKANLEQNMNHLQRTQYYEANSSLIQKVQCAVSQLRGNHKAYIGTINSEDEFICLTRVDSSLYTSHIAYCSEMEGTAIAFTCFANKIPFVAIRIISDKVDPDGDENFEDFVDIAARTMSRIVKDIL